MTHCKKNKNEEFNQIKLEKVYRQIEKSKQTCIRQKGQQFGQNQRAKETALCSQKRLNSKGYAKLDSDASRIFNIKKSKGTDIFQSKKKNVYQITELHTTSPGTFHFAQPISL